MSKKILISGANGFLGSWATRVLAGDSRYEVVALVRPDSNLNRIRDLSKIVVIQESSDNWHLVIRKVKPEIWVALDWAGVARDARNDSFQFNNTRRWIQMAEACVESGTQHILGFGSQAETGRVRGEVQEDLKANPTSRYGEAKVAARIGLKNITANSACGLTWARVFSVYGPMESPGWFIPSLIRSIKSQKDFEMTSGEQNWNYLHGYDFATAVQTVVSCDASGDIDFGSTQITTIANVAQILGNYLNGLSFIKMGSIPFSSNQEMSLQPDLSTLIELGWSESIGLTNGLRSTADWFLGASSNYLESILGERIQFPLPRFE